MQVDKSKEHWRKAFRKCWKKEPEKMLEKRTEEMLEKRTDENAGEKHRRKAHEYWKFSQSRKSQSIIQEKLHDKPLDILISKEKPFS